MNQGNNQGTNADSSENFHGVIKESGAGRKAIVKNYSSRSSTSLIFFLTRTRFSILL